MEDSSAIVASLQRSVHYLHPYFRQMLDKEELIVKASRLLFEIQTPTPDDLNRLRLLYTNNRGRSLSGNFGK